MNQHVGERHRIETSAQLVFAQKLDSFVIPA